MTSLIILIVFIILSLILVASTIVATYAGVMNAKYPELNLLNIDLSKSIFIGVCTACLYAFLFAYCSSWIGELFSNLIILSSMGLSGLIGTAVCFKLHHDSRDERKYINVCDKIESLESIIKKSENDLGQVRYKMGNASGTEYERYQRAESHMSEIHSSYKNLLIELETQRSILEAKINGADLSMLELTSAKKSKKQLNYSLDRIDAFTENEDNKSSLKRISKKYN